MKYSKENLERLLENLFNPIENKDYGLYWNVSNNKTEPLANASELLTYIRKESKEGSFINRYANLTEDLVLENNIYLDFDLTNKDYLKAERSLTEAVLEKLAEEEIDVEQASNYHEKNNNVILKQIQQKYKKNYSVENGFSKGFNSFIDSLTLAEEGALKKLVGSKEKEEVKDLTEAEIQKYYLNKFEHDYLKEPFQEAITVANYFESIGIATFLNWSGSKGLHLRIPITTINFNDVPELAENPEAVKLFLEKLAELIETKILEKPYKKSSLDYAVFKKGMQRLPTSKHNKTKLYANFIEPSFNYIEAIDYLENKVPVYLPSFIDTEKNTEILVESDIFKATIKQASEEATSTFKSEEANPNYKFNGKHKELLEVISKVYLPSVRNEVGFRIVHLLRRSNFKKEEVEAIFKELHEDLKDYNTTIKGSIDHAYKTEKLVGLRSLLKWLSANASEEVKPEVIDYFKRKFNYYEAPTEKVLEDVLLIHEKEYNLTEVTTSKKKYYLLKNLEYVEGNNLEIHKEKAVVYFKQHNKLIAKLELKKIQGTAEKGLVPTSKVKLDKFISRINKIIGLDKKIITEAIEELDVYLDYLEGLQEEEEIIQEQEEEITEAIENEGLEHFYFYGTEETFLQNEKGIFKEETDKEGIPFLKPVANVVIKNVNIILDSLGILEPVYNVTYYNRTFNKEVTVEYLTEKQLTEEFIKAKVFHNATKETVNYVLNSFIIEGSKNELIETRTEAYLEGYFLVNNKVVENTKLKNLRYTKKDLKEAILLLNEVMKSRTEEGKANDSSVYRFMLWNPFSYCLKQLGYSKANYSLILIGKSQTNKTGATNIGRLFYDHAEEETTGSTVSVLGSKLEENTFLSVFDECSHLFYLTEALNVMKRLVYEKTARATKDRNDNKKIDEFQALALAMFILNEEITFKDFITNRYKIIHYSSNSYITDSAIAKFNEKYVPEAPNTILKKLAVIGKCFSEKLIAIIEDPSARKKLFNIEEVTIEILKEIEKEAEVKFLPEMLQPTETSDKYNYDVATEIRTLLNAEFKKRINKHDNYYIASDFIQSARNSNFNFLIYDPVKRKFLIKYSNFIKFINKHIEEYVELEEVLEILDLTSVLEQEAKEDNKKYERFIRKANRIGSKVHNGFYLDVEAVANKIFEIQIGEETEEITTISSVDSSS